MTPVTKRAATIRQSHSPRASWSRLRPAWCSETGILPSDVLSTDWISRVSLTRWKKRVAIRDPNDALWRIYQKRRLGFGNWHLSYHSLTFSTVDSVNRQRHATQTQSLGVFDQQKTSPRLVQRLQGCIDFVDVQFQPSRWLHASVP